MLTTQNQAKVQTALTEMRQNLYRGPKCADIVKNLAASFGPAEATTCTDVLDHLEQSLTQKLQNSGAQVPNEVKTAILNARADRAFVAPAPQAPAFAPPPRYTAMANPFAAPAPAQHLAQQMDLLNFNDAPAAAHAPAPALVRHATGFVPSARAEQLYKIYEENKDDFEDAANRDAKFLVQEFKLGTPEHNEVIDAVYVMGRIALDQRNIAEGNGETVNTTITVKYFSQKKSEAIKIDSLADLERAVTRQGTKFPKIAPLSSNLDTALSDYLRRAKGEVKKDEDVTPVSLYLICDGTDSDDPEDVMGETVGELKEASIPKKSLGIQGIRVGDNAKGAKNLDAMDDSDSCPRDQMDHIAFKDVTDVDTLRKAMFGGSNGKLDKAKV